MFLGVKLNFRNDFLIGKERLPPPTKKKMVKNKKIKVVLSWPNLGDNWSEIIIDILIFPQHIMGECENSFN